MQKKILAGVISVAAVGMIVGLAIHQPASAVSQSAMKSASISVKKKVVSNNLAWSEHTVSSTDIQQEPEASNKQTARSEITAERSASPLVTRVEDLLSKVSIFDEDAPLDQFLALQKEIVENDEAADQLVQMMRSSEYAQEHRMMMAELLSARTDEKTVNFTAELISDLSPLNQALGEQLANMVMINGNVSGMLSPIVSTTYYEEENKDTVRSVLYGVGNLSMSDEEKSSVAAMLEGYMGYGDAEIQAVALQSLASLAASSGDKDKVKAIFNQYRSKDYSNDVRYTAVESLYNVDLTQDPDPVVKSQLEQIANDGGEDYNLRSLAMQLLAGFNNS